MRNKTPIERLIDWLEATIEGMGDPNDFDEIDDQYVFGLKDALSHAQMLNELYG